MLEYAFIPACEIHAKENLHYLLNYISLKGLVKIWQVWEHFIHRSCCPVTFSTNVHTVSYISFLEEELGAILLCFLQCRNVGITGQMTRLKKRLNVAVNGPNAVG